MLHIKPLVLELRSVDRERTRSVAFEEITTLDHELGDPGVSGGGVEKVAGLTLCMSARYIELMGPGAYRWNVAPL